MNKKHIIFIFKNMVIFTFIKLCYAAKKRVQVHQREEVQPDLKDHRGGLLIKKCRMPFWMSFGAFCLETIPLKVSL